MEDKLIKYKTAKLASEKGFQIITDKLYNPRDPSAEVLTGNIVNSILKSQSDLSKHIFCCTQSLLQLWLREVHKIHITITSISQKSWMYRITKPGQKLTEGAYGEDFYTYEEALEDALQYSLTALV